MDITKPDNDLMKLNDKFREKVYKLLELAKQNWLNIKVFEWRRSNERQNYLYSIWRTIQLEKRPITWTLKSKHLDGMAIDLVFIKDGKITWEWDWKKVVSIAKWLWLKSLAPTERCHIQI